MKLTLSDLRHHAIAHSFGRSTGLRQAMDRLGFIQADPIRAPARAQELILRQRVKDYRVGDLDAAYLRLGLEEDFLYAYGFVPQATWRLLHPRRLRGLSAGDKRVLDVVTQHKKIHPRDLESSLGKRRQLNAWGGYSKATTRSLQKLHYLSLLRVAGREKGVRLYAPTAAAGHEPLGAAERLRQLILIIATILAPLPERSLRAALNHLRYAAPDLGERRPALQGLLDSGELASAEVEGLRYVWPAGPLRRKAPESRVRFLAPFDPLVWDRLRFEHLWGWAYRFEAYTPPPKRKLGYYAMPLLWRSDIIGWVNVARRGSDLVVEPGFVLGRQPDEAAFETAFAAETESFRRFLQPRAGRGGEQES